MMDTKECLYQFVLRIADSNMIMAQRLSEWCSKGPMLEEDIAISNIALDMFGQAESFYTYASTLQGDKTPDDLAFLRSEREYRNKLLVEIPNGDFAYSMLKILFFSMYNSILYQSLQDSLDETLKGLSTKALIEVKYHLRHSTEWIIRLGKGTQESKKRVHDALPELLLYKDDLFLKNEIDAELISLNICKDAEEWKAAWEFKINEICVMADIQLPSTNYSVLGGINGIHTEHLGHLLCEMQYLQRTYPNAQW